jgi:hypothetical protein
MVHDAPQSLATLADGVAEDGMLFKLRRDPRVTHIGRFLRRYSLDDLPELWNVLRGGMSLVGPRAPLPREVEAFDRRMGRILLVRPGLTGLWEIAGRSDLSWEEARQTDITYVENWSLATDVRILARRLHFSSDCDRVERTNLCCIRLVQRDHRRAAPLRAGPKRRAAKPITAHASRFSGGQHKREPPGDQGFLSGRPTSPYTAAAALPPPAPAWAAKAAPFTGRSTGDPHPCPARRTATGGRGRRGSSWRASRMGSVTER